MIRGIRGEEEAHQEAAGSCGRPERTGVDPRSGRGRDCRERGSGGPHYVPRARKGSDYSERHRPEVRSHGRVPKRPHVLALLRQEARFPEPLEDAAIQDVQLFHSGEAVPPSKAGLGEECPRDPQMGVVRSRSPERPAQWRCALVLPSESASQA